MSELFDDSNDTLYIVLKDSSDTMAKFQYSELTPFRETIYPAGSSESPTAILYSPHSTDSSFLDRHPNFLGICEDSEEDVRRVIDIEADIGAGAIAHETAKRIVTEAKGAVVSVFEVFDLPRVDIDVNRDTSSAFGNVIQESLRIRLQEERLRILTMVQREIEKRMRRVKMHSQIHTMNTMNILDWNTLRNELLQAGKISRYNKAMNIRGNWKTQRANCFITGNSQKGNNAPNHNFNFAGFLQGRMSEAGMAFTLDDPFLATPDTMTPLYFEMSNGVCLDLPKAGVIHEDPNDVDFKIWSRTPCREKTMELGTIIGLAAADFLRLIEAQTSLELQMRRIAG